MYLLINPSQKDTIVLTLFDEMTTEQKEYPAKNRELLNCIDSFLHAKNLDKKSIQGIITIVGAGGFTSTRIGTTLANAWAYAEKIPVLAIALDEAADPQSLIPRLLAQTPGEYVLAAYSGEPNIGK